MISNCIIIFPGHGYELPYVFHTVDKVFTNPASPPTDGDKKMQEIMMTYWVNFVHNGDPNIPYERGTSSYLASHITRVQENIDEVEWPKFTAAEPKMRFFNTGISTNVSLQGYLL